MSDELHLVASVTCFYTVDTNGVTVGRVTRSAPIEIVHGKAGVARYLVQTLAICYSFLHHVLVTKDFII